MLVDEARLIDHQVPGLQLELIAQFFVLGQLLGSRHRCSEIHTRRNHRLVSIS
jgi:hypothetical protein